MKKILCVMMAVMLALAISPLAACKGHEPDVPKEEEMSFGEKLMISQQEYINYAERKKAVYDEAIAQGGIKTQSVADHLRLNCRLSTGGNFLSEDEFLSGLADIEATDEQIKAQGEREAYRTAAKEYYGERIAALDKDYAWASKLDQCLVAMKERENIVTTERFSMEFIYWGGWTISGLDNTISFTSDEELEVHVMTELNGPVEMDVSGEYVISGELLSSPVKLTSTAAQNYSIVPVDIYFTANGVTGYALIDVVVWQNYMRAPICVKAVAFPKGEEITRDEVLTIMANERSALSVEQ